jgi:hypothetical protein
VVSIKKKEMINSKKETEKIPEGKLFLNGVTEHCQKAKIETELFEKCYSGEKHQKTIECLGATISLLYRSACCFWGCKGGDHVKERLIGKAVNQAICAFKLYRYCYYDESLMITRGIGEIANLLHLFNLFPEKIEDWKTQSDRGRSINFKPSKVRDELSKNMDFVPIDRDRYSKLCGIGTHPNPNEIPGHYSGTGVPILGMLVQPVGAYVAITELAYALGLVSVVTPKILELNNEISKEMKEKGVELIRNLGSFHILNYHEGLKEAHDIENEKEKE